MHLRVIGVAGIVAASLVTTVYSLVFRNVSTLEHALTDASLRDSERGGDGSPSNPDIWFFFRSSDCQIGSELISRLNVMDKRGLRIHGVLLDPPRLRSEARRLIQQYNASFAIDADSDGAWYTILRRERFSPPLYAVVNGVHVVGVMSPDTNLSALIALNGSAPGPKAIESVDHLAPPRRLLGTLLAQRVMLVGANVGLLRPELFACDSSDTIVYDYGDNLVKAFDSTGKKIWVYGLSENGDVHFLNPVDLRIDSGGDILIYDAAGHAVIRLGRTGRLLGRTPIRWYAAQLLPRANHGIWVIGPQFGQTFGFAMSAAGDVVSRMVLPTRVSALDPVARQPLVATSPGRNEFVAGFHNGGDFVVWSKGNTLSPKLVPGIEPLPSAEVSSWHDGATIIKRLASNANTGTLAMAVGAQDFYVLFGGQTRYARRIVDVYRTKDGAYQGSYILPRPVSGLVRVGDGFIVREDDALNTFAFVSSVTSPTNSPSGKH